MVVVTKGHLGKLSFKFIHIHMTTGFVATGCGIKKGRGLGRINIVDVAPTLAGLMGFSMGATAGKMVLLK